MAGRTAGVKRKSKARLLPNTTPDGEIADAVAEMLRGVVAEADTAVVWKNLRVTVEPATQDSAFHQLRVGVHVE